MSIRGALCVEVFFLNVIFQKVKGRSVVIQMCSKCSTVLQVLNGAPEGGGRRGKKITVLDSLACRVGALAPLACCRAAMAVRCRSTGSPAAMAFPASRARQGRYQAGAYFISNARKNTRWLSSHGMAETLASSSFSLADLKAGRASVYLVLPANYLSQHGRFLRLFVRCGIEAMARKLPSGELRGAQCLFMLDEFFSLGYIDEIAKAAGLMRGYGLQLWPILQDLGQLVTLYGREGSETFFANADVHQFFGNTDTLTLEQISARLGVKDMGEVPLPPAVPSTVHTGFGEALGVMSGQSKKAAYKVTGQALGGAISLAEKVHSAKTQSHYQDDMNHYQRYMAEHGRPRLNPDQVSNLIRKKDDVVADHMISFVFGREPLLLKPAPYFRALATPPLGAVSRAPAAPAFHVKRSEIVALAILVPFWAGGAWLGWAVYGGWLGLFGGVALGIGVSFALDYFGFLGSSDDD